MIDWDHLRIVLAIRNGGSLQAAAIALNLDRATVVRRLEALEAGLGARLFDRRRDGCVLTKAGVEIIATVETISASVTELQNRVGGADLAARGTVTVTMAEFMAVNVVIPELPRFRAMHPDVTIRITTGFDFLNLAQGEADIALRNRRPDQNTLVARRIGTAGMAFYASMTFLEERGMPDGGFAGYDVIVPDEEILRLPLFGRGAEIASSGRSFVRINDLGTAVAAARSGLGLALLPCAAVIQHPDLVPVAPGLVAQNESFLVTHRDLRRHGRIRVVADFLVRLHAEKEAAISGRDIASRLALSDIATFPSGPAPSPDRQKP